MQFVDRSENVGASWSRPRLQETEVYSPRLCAPVQELSVEAALQVRFLFAMSPSVIHPGDPRFHAALTLSNAAAWSATLKG